MILIYYFKRITFKIFYLKRIVFYKWYRFKAVIMNLKKFSKLMIFHKSKVFKKILTVSKKVIKI